MARACINANKTGSLVLNNDWLGKGNSEVYRAIFSDHIRSNTTKPTGQNIRVQMNNVPKSKHVFQLLKTKLKDKRPTNEQQLTDGEVKA